MMAREDRYVTDVNEVVWPWEEQEKKDCKLPGLKYPGQPRDDHGRFGSGGGGGRGESSGKSKKRRELEGRAVGMVESGLSESKLSQGDEEEFREASGEILERMSDRSLELVVEDGNQFRFYDSPEAVTKGLPSAVELPPEAEVVGFYDHEVRKVHTDGSEDRDQLFSHEVAHAIDRGGRFSGSEEWEEAWTAEHLEGQMSEYATISPAEGFAEFGRAILGTPYLRKDVVSAMFPKSYAFWEKEGLI